MFAVVVDFGKYASQAIVEIPTYLAGRFVLAILYSALAVQVCDVSRKISLIQMAFVDHILSVEREVDWSPTVYSHRTPQSIVAISEGARRPTIYALPQPVLTVPGICASAAGELVAVGVIGGICLAVHNCKHVGGVVAIGLNPSGQLVIRTAQRDFVRYTVPLVVIGVVIARELPEHYGASCLIT